MMPVLQNFKELQNLKGPNELSITTGSQHEIKVSNLGQVKFEDSFESMSRFASERTGDERDQIWLLEHSPVYTQGTSCKTGTLLDSDIPTVKTDRGGQITYHGPGQIVMYPLLKLKRYRLGVKAFVAVLEQSVIDTLAEYGVEGARRDDAPGVYVDGEKIAALGLRIRRGTSYHGLSLNIDMDLLPFNNIDPCGYQGLRVTQLSNLTSRAQLPEVAQRLLRNFVALI